jgi:hypothetical protein
LELFVPSIRFRFDEVSREALAARVRSEFGASARIISASEVRVGGVGGFFARRYVDVVVDVPNAPNPATRGQSGAVGLAALLEEAERAERAEVPRGAAPLVPVVSTQSPDFEMLMTDLKSYSDLAPKSGLLEAPGAPKLYDEPGRLVLFAGLGDDAMVVARSLARSVRWSDVRMGGRILGDALPRVDDRRAAAEYRARCIASGSVGLLAWGVGIGASGAQSSASSLRAIDADQIWIVVDAARKADDTAAWVGMLRATVNASAIAVLHSVETASPDSVNALGLPIGWSDTVG